MSNYVTIEEMRAISDLIDFLEGSAQALSFECKVLDSNGDVLGRVKISDSTAYAFHPGSR